MRIICRNICVVYHFLVETTNNKDSTRFLHYLTDYLAAEVASHKMFTKFKQWIQQLFGYSNNVLVVTCVISNCVRNICMKFLFRFIVSLHIAPFTHKNPSDIFTVTEYNCNNVSVRLSWYFFILLPDYCYLHTVYNVNMCLWLSICCHVVHIVLYSMLSKA